MGVIIKHVMAFFVNVLFVISLISWLLAINLNYALNLGKWNNLFKITIHESISLPKKKTLIDLFHQYV